MVWLVDYVEVVVVVKRERRATEKSKEHCNFLRATTTNGDDDAHLFESFLSLFFSLSLACSPSSSP